MPVNIQLSKTKAAASGGGSQKSKVKSQKCLMRLG
jgi:hypothetical protein